MDYVYKVWTRINAECGEWPSGDEICLAHSYYFSKYEYAFDYYQLLKELHRTRKTNIRGYGIDTIYLDDPENMVENIRKKLKDSAFDLRDATSDADVDQA